MTSLDDLTLLQWFVSGDATLEANQSLHIQPASSSRQLLGRRGLLLATAYDAALPPRIEVRRDTVYTSVLHQILIDHHFVPTGQDLDSQTLCYDYCPIPDGYHILYGKSRQLWKLWWSHPSRLSDRHLQLDLFVLVKHQWYPVRDIALNDGTLYVETLRGETIHHGDDMMVWLEKDHAEEADKTCFWTAPPTAQPNPASTVQSGAQPNRIAAVPSPPSFAAADSAPPATVDPKLAPVAYAVDGRVYVQTAVGLVVVEGNNLKAYSSASRTTAVGKRQRR